MVRKYIVLLVFFLLLPGADGAEITAFSSPDSSYAALTHFLRGANSSLQVSVYTFTSPEIMDALIEKKRAGVAVEVLVEDGPAGGIDDAERNILCRMASEDIGVFLYGGPLRFMHAKYIVADNTSYLVTSENFGYSGYYPGGTYGNRGWGASVADTESAAALAEIYSHDRSLSTPFICETEGEVSPWRTSGAYRKKFPEEYFRGQSVRIISSPGSDGDILEMIASANTSIRVEQLYIYRHWGSSAQDPGTAMPNPLLEALIQKAREGVDVKIILDGSYYNMDPADTRSNLHTIGYVNGVAKRENIPVVAKKISDAKGLAAVHNKGVVIDDRIALVSSMNWNENSLRENREIGVIISGDASGYYAGVFDSDWSDEAESQAGSTDPWPLFSFLAMIVLIIISIYFYTRKNKQRVEL
jgi:phosphatidylserine/phosphatidylglycerophosphate/cardiolipin synthase-like enzyme